MLDLKDIQYFVAVYEARGFLKASYGLHTVQSNVSLRIARLEGKLGEVLFIRNRRGVDATPAADELYDRAKPVLASVRNLGAGLGHRSRRMAQAPDGASGERAVSA